MSHQDYARSADFVNAANHYLSNLKRENYQIYNVEVAKATSHTFAILLSLLESKRDYYTKTKQLADHHLHGTGWFYLTHESVYEMTGLSRKEQDTAIKLGRELKIIECVSFGLPNKRHFRINAIHLYDHIIKYISTNLSQTDKLDCEDENPPSDCSPEPEPNKPVCTEGANQFVPKGQTAPIIYPSHHPDDDPGGIDDYCEIEKVIIRNCRGIETVVTKQEVSKLAQDQGWPPEAVPTLWEKLCSVGAPITSWARFLNSCWISMKNSFQVTNTKQFKSVKKSSSSPKVEPQKSQHPSWEELAERQRKNAEMFKAAGLC